MNEVLLISIIAFLSLQCWVFFGIAQLQTRKSNKLRTVVNQQIESHSILVKKLCRCQIISDLDNVLKQIGVVRPRAAQPKKRIIVPR